MSQLSFFRLSALIFFPLWFSSVCHGTIYSFIDKKGITHFTNVPSNPRFKPVTRSNSHSLYSLSNHQFHSIISEASHLYGVDSAIIKAVIQVESNFDPYAVSPKGAQGLMQLMPSTATEMNVTDCFDPRENIFGGTRYLKKLLKIFDGDLHLALASYNAGLTMVRRSHTIPDISETKNYVRKVLLHYRNFK